MVCMTWLEKKGRSDRKNPAAAPLMNSTRSFKRTKPGRLANAQCLERLLPRVAKPISKVAKAPAATAINKALVGSSRT